MAILWLKNPHVQQFCITGSINSFSRNSLHAGDMGITESFSSCEGTKLETMITLSISFCPSKLQTYSEAYTGYERFEQNYSWYRLAQGIFWKIKASVTTTAILVPYFNNGIWTVYTSYPILHRIYWFILWFTFLFNNCHILTDYLEKVVKIFYFFPLELLLAICCDSGCLCSAFRGNELF